MTRTGTATCLLALAATLAGGCVTAKKFHALEDEHAQLSARYDALVTKSDGMRMEVDELESYITVLRESNDYLGSFYEDLLGEFRPQLEADEMQLIVYPDRLSLALAQDVSFASASAKLSEDGDGTVEKLASLVQRHPDRRFVVEGHTDSVPISTAQYGSNWQLGAARAVSVVEALVAAGVPAERLAAASYADTAPLVEEGTPEDLRMNRRVEVSFQPTLEELPGHRALVDAAADVTYARGADPTAVPELVGTPHQVPVAPPAEESGTGAASPVDPGTMYRTPEEQP